MEGLTRSSWNPGLTPDRRRIDGGRHPEQSHRTRSGGERKSRAQENPRHG